MTRGEQTGTRADAGGAGRLLDPLRRVYREIAKFGVVGAVGVLVNLVSFALLHQVMQPVRAGVLATVIAIVFNYVGYRYWVYRHTDKKSRSREITLFLAFSLVGLVIENGVLYASVYGLGLTTGLEQVIAKNVIGLGLGTVFRFWSYRTWVFRALPATKQVADEAEAIVALAEARESAKSAKSAAKRR
jgi:putative flippase GtrA